jgi:hypothetical protein
VVTGWGAVTIPVAVAVMVKLNDIVASTLYLRPSPRRSSGSRAVRGTQCGVIRCRRRHDLPCGSTMMTRWPIRRPGRTMAIRRAWRECGERPAAPRA